MRELAFDIETDGLMDTVSVINSLCAVDINTGEELVWRPDEIELGLKALQDADLLVAHNGISYDVPVIRKLYPWWSPPLVRDTLVLSRIAYPGLRDSDFARFGAQGLRQHGAKLFNGSHSLDAHGVRLGFRKSVFTGSWTDGWSEELEAYCLQDCRVTSKLYKSLVDLDLSPTAVDLEHRFATVCHDMEMYGFSFDLPHAQALHAQLTVRTDELTDALQRQYGGWYEAVGPVVTPKRSVKYKTKPEVVAGCEYQRVRHVTLNPTSRQHIEKVLRSEGWVPKVFTENSGQAKIDETTLLDIADKYPSAKLFAEQFTLQKRLGLLNSWIEAERDGRVHAQVIPNSAATSRTSSRNPNLQQVPAVHSAYGRECRKCFRASPGRVLLAADLDKAELMLLAHYMYAYDNGAYAAMLAESDIHQVNADAMGVSRALGKKVIFSMVYGASDKYIGEITGLSGKQVRSDLMEAFPALEQLMQQIRARVSGHSGFRALDKRWIACPAQFKALNYLIQSSTSIVGKQWAATAVERLRAAEVPCDLVMYVHDEIQFDCDPDYVDYASEVIRSSLDDACKKYNLRVAMTCETQTGQDWSESH